MPIYEKFIGRSRDSFVSLKDCQENFKIIYDNDFNYAYDVVDVLGTEKPDKLALLYVSNEQEEMHLTFGDMKRLSECRLVLCMDVLCRNPPRSHLLMCKNFPDKP